MPCNLCGAESPRSLFDKNNFTIVECASCGLRYVDPTPADDVISAAYGPGYYADPTGQTYGHYFAEAEQRVAAFAHRIPAIRKFVPAGRLLDVGCAAGYFMLAARPHFEVHGTELSEAAARHGRETFNLDIRTGRVDALDYPAEFFDVVTMWDTIEHLQDPRASLEAIHRVLKPGGLLVVSTADAGSVTARMYGRRWVLYTPPWHLFYFSRSTLTAMLERSGFKTERIRRGGVPLLNTNVPTGFAAVAARLLANRYSAPMLSTLGLGFILTAYARKAMPAQGMSRR